MVLINGFCQAPGVEKVLCKMPHRQIKKMGNESPDFKKASSTLNHHGSKSIAND